MEIIKEYTVLLYREYFTILKIIRNCIIEIVSSKSYHLKKNNHFNPSKQTRKKGPVLRFVQYQIQNIYLLKDNTFFLPTSRVVSLREIK